MFYVNENHEYQHRQERNAPKLGAMDELPITKGTTYALQLDKYLL